MLRQPPDVAKVVTEACKHIPDDQDDDNSHSMPLRNETAVHNRMPDRADPNAEKGKRNAKTAQGSKPGIEGSSFRTHCVPKGWNQCPDEEETEQR